MDYRNCVHKQFTGVTLGVTREMLDHPGASLSEQHDFMAHRPCSFVSHFYSSVCIHINIRKWKNCEKLGRPGPIHHVNNIR